MVCGWLYLLCLLQFQFRSQQLNQRVTGKSHFPPLYVYVRTQSNDHKSTDIDCVALVTHNHKYSHRRHEFIYNFYHIRQSSLQRLRIGLWSITRFITYNHKLNILSGLHLISSSADKNHNTKSCYFLIAYYHTMFRGTR
jgi:hypothetical protein